VEEAVSETLRRIVVRLQRAEGQIETEADAEEACRK
jgi:hypothetical protein